MYRNTGIKLLKIVNKRDIKKSEIETLRGKNSLELARAHEEDRCVSRHLVIEMKE